MSGRRKSFVPEIKARLRACSVEYARHRQKDNTFEAMWIAATRETQQGLLDLYSKVLAEQFPGVMITGHRYKYWIGDRTAQIVIWFRIPDPRWQEVQYERI